MHYVLVPLIYAARGTNFKNCLSIIAVSDSLLSSCLRFVTKYFSNAFDYADVKRA